LDEISKLEDTSRAALIRRAIDRMLAEDARKGEVAKEAFGLWSYQQKDGMVIEADLRGVSKPSAKTVNAPKQKQVEAPVTEDRFVTEPPPAIVEQDATPAVAEIVVPPPPPPPPPAVAAPREATQTAVDPLAAFFAGVKP